MYLISFLDFELDFNLLWVEANLHLENSLKYQMNLHSLVNGVFTATYVVKIYWYDQPCRCVDGRPHQLP